MKHTWFIIGVLIISILIHPLTFMDQAAPITRNDNTIECASIDKYIRDWSIKNDSIDTFFKNMYTIIEPSQARYCNHENNRLGETKNSPMTSPWPMQSHDIRHTGRSLLGTANNLGTEIWRFQCEERGQIGGSAVIDNNGTLYFPSTDSHELYALYPNGTKKWSYVADGAIWCTPALAEDGTIYFTNWGGHYFHALDLNGTLKWLYAQEGSSTSSPSIAEDGTIYFGDNDHIIYALNPNGTEKWRYNSGYLVMGAPAIGEDGTIYIGSCDHYFYALNPNGTLRWRFGPVGEIKGSASIAPDGTIYVPSFDGYLYALNPNGTMNWRASTGGSVAGAGVALAEDGTIYVGTEQLRAFYQNGTMKWTIDVQGSIYGTVPAVSADGTIYVSAGGSLVAVNSNGTERWRKKLTIAQIHSSPSIGPDDRVYVGSETYELIPLGFLHAFGTMENNQPPEKPIIDGPSQVKIKTDVTFTFQASDPDLNPISFFIFWGDSTNDQTIDYMSGMAVSFTHRWTTKSTYTIQAKAIDTFGLESDWATFVVKAPLSSEPPQFPFLEWLLERFPHAFPLFRYILDYY